MEGDFIINVKSNDNKRLPTSSSRKICDASRVIMGSNENFSAEYVSNRLKKNPIGRISGKTSERRNLNPAETSSVEKSKLTISHPTSSAKLIRKESQADTPWSRNPLQVGIEAKRHSAHDSFLNAVSESITPLDEPVFSKISWGDFGKRINMHPHLLSCITNKFKFTFPTSIQMSSYKSLVEGFDVLIKAQTGSGKTFAYALPMLQNLMTFEPPLTRVDGPKALILLPTRELAAQTFTVIQQLCTSCVRIVPGLLVGGTKRKNEKRSIRKGLNIIISTPQRLLDHIGKTCSLDLSTLKWVVIDEADRLVELGFERDMRKILDSVSSAVEQVNPTGSAVQTVLLSATLTPGVENLAGLTLRNAIKCEVFERKKPTENGDIEQEVAEGFAMPSGLKHFLLIVPCKQRLVALASFLLLKAKYSKKSGKIIVFFATQDCVDFHHQLFTETLCTEGDMTDEEYASSNLKFFRLHGSMAYNERRTVFQQFAASFNGILFTTDVASRGLDLAGISWVVQYHVSCTPIDYVHRVGRTARAGGRGKALLFLHPEETSYTSKLSSTLGLKVIEVNLVELLQVALYHQRLTLQRKSVNTVEEAAAGMSRYFAEALAANRALAALAESAYVSFTRAYASFPRAMREHFAFQNLHLGHLACAFGLAKTPRSIAASVAKRKPSKTARISGEVASGEPPPKFSRRLEFADDEGDDKGGAENRHPKQTRKPKPSELAKINMLAEYGL